MVIYILALYVLFLLPMNDKGSKRKIYTLATEECEKIREDQRDLQSYETRSFLHSTREGKLWFYLSLQPLLGSYVMFEERLRDNTKKQMRVNFFNYFDWSQEKKKIEKTINKKR